MKKSYLKSIIKEILSESVACGECFKYVFDWSKKIANTSKENKTVIIHGTIRGEWDDHRYDHAWIEYNNKVFDWQTQKTKPNGLKKKSVFYDIMSAKIITKYSPIDILINSVRKGNYGPWK